MPLFILVTGDRNWADEEAIQYALGHEVSAYEGFLEAGGQII